MNFVHRKIALLCENLKKQSVSDAGEIENLEYVPCGYKTDNTPPAEGWQAFEKNQRVGGTDGHFWFRAGFKTPKPIEGKRLFLNLITGKDGGWDARNPQSILYLNGKMMQGIDINHTDLLLKPDTEYQLYVYLYTGMIDMLVDFIPSLKWVDTKIEKLFYDFNVPLEACLVLNPESENYIRIMTILEQAANLVFMRRPLDEEYYKSLDAASEFLDKELYHGICGNSTAVVNCIGHTHIDVAWLWTLAQTREKAQRSFATVIELMKEYPEYLFMSSQPQLYQYVKESAPEIYEQIKQRVKEGRWEPEGAMWLEADCNLISGESMVRQILHGKRFMKEEFGVDSKILWLPDVFGYSAAMPQILKKCGVDHFVTSKISWNEFNKLPYDSFQWEGIDGTEIFTNFITAQNMPNDGKPSNFTTYVGDITPSMVLGTWNRYQQKEYNNETVITFGFGDGGGGPTREMLERQRRLSYGLPGFPKTVMSTAGSYLAKVQKNFEENTKKLRRTPKWVGELYLEFHRGTYTSIAKNKKNNRKCEFLLQKAEALSSIDSLLNGGVYPAKKLYSAWETVLLHQFHDIIPGSSIFEVYEDSDRDYKTVYAAGNAVIADKLASLTARLATEGGLMIYNPLGFARRATVKVGGKTVETSVVPALGWTIVKDAAPSSPKVTVEGNTVENDCYRLTLEQSGRISSLYDKRFDREVFKPGMFGNEIQVFEDFPKEYDAWEITNYYKQKMWVLDEDAVLEPVFDGDRAGIRISRNYLTSRIVQIIYLYNTLERIDIETEIDWNEEHQLVKAAFPLDVHANTATYEIQFGNIQRPTHANTSWDEAKFEVCGHKWADISENGYGVSLLNDCKYGFSTEGSTLKLTLLKCATYPNPHADKGHHSFTYSLLPHGGDYREAGTVREAYSLNQPLECREVKANKGNLPESFSLVSCCSENVVIDTVKKADDSEDCIIRLYEAFDRRTKAVLELGFDFEKAVLCDMLEQEIAPLPKKGRSVSVPLRNFEIATVKIIK